MLRAVLAVALAVALLAASLPAIDGARRDHADREVGSQLRQVGATLERFAARNDPVPPRGAGARATVRLHLPGRTWGTARVAYVAVGGAKNATDPAGSDVLAWRVAGGPERTLRVDGIDLQVGGDGRIGPDGEPLVLHEPGRHRLVLALVSRDGRPVVLVRRFKAGNVATRPHARRARPAGSNRRQRLPV